MRTNTPRLNHPGRFVALLCVVCGLLLCIALPGSAEASFEQVKTFGEENLQLRTASGSAVNTTGAGGVPAGTVYIVAERSASVAMYSAQGEFREAWGWGVAEVGKGEYQRCGPDGEPSHPTCAPINDGSQAGSTEGWGLVGEGLGQLFRPQGISVDQATGNVYVFNRGRKHQMVQVFSADGSQRLAGFGEAGRPGNFPEPAESIEEGPAKIHETSSWGSSLAVDEAGRVYIADSDPATAVPPHLTRIMFFEPEAGNYEHYVYAGRAQDLPSQGSGAVAVDYAGDVYAATDTSIYEYAPPSPTPVCKLDLPTGGIEGMTADPATGEVYYFNHKKRNLHRLVCSGGNFVDTEAINPVPKAENYLALAFNPATSFDATRPPGILYAATEEAFKTEGSPTREVGVAHVFAPGPVLHPVVESAAASEVGTAGASLHAVVNPKGAAATYVFQYISDAAYQANDPGERFAGAGELPNGGGHLQSGNTGVPVAVVLSGLQPHTQYHFRVVADNCTEGQMPALCTTESNAQTFRTFPASAGNSPDRRAFEMVSPPQKSGGEVWPADSQLFTPSCLECKPGRTGNRLPSFSAPDGEKVVYQGSPFSVDAALSRDSYMSVRSGSGWKTTTLNPNLGGSGEAQGLVGFDRTLTTGVLKQNRPSLVPSAPSEANNLYTLTTADPGGLIPVLSETPPNTGGGVKLEYAGGSNDLSHVIFTANDALTGETAFAPAAEYQVNQENLYEYIGSEGRTQLVNVLPGNTTTVPGAVFGSLGTAGENGPEINNYSHVIADDGSKVFWSSPSGQVYVREDGVRTSELPDHVGKFLTASADGQAVLLTDGKLLELEGEEGSVDLTQGQGGFLGIAGQSSDLSQIYFVDTAALTAPNSRGSIPTAGKDNLYLWDKDSTRFIATLSGDASGNWRSAPARRSAQASPDGAWLAFQSTAPLTGQEKTGPCQFNNAPPHEFLQVPCNEVFLYSAAADQLSCPSCSPTEEAPLGESHLAKLTNPVPSLEQQPYLTDSGRLFFDSANRLSPTDTNNGAEDVYEYEPGGVGTCNESEGCVSLVSAGDEFTDSNLLSIDSSGRNVFFTTREQLSLRDRDELIDLYDAREDGGIPGETETIRAECQGEACQSPVQVPNDPTPGSSTFEGPGNVTEAHRKKPKKKKHHHKKHHHKKKAKSNRGGGK